VQRDLYQPKETYNRDLQKTPTKETYKRDLQKRPTKETDKRDLFLRYGLKSKGQQLRVGSRYVKRDLYRPKETYKRDLYYPKGPTKETSIRDIYAAKDCCCEEVVNMSKEIYIN